MSNTSVLERTTGKAISGISLTSNGNGEGDARSQYLKIEIGGNVDEPGLVWRSEHTPLPWMAAGYAEEEPTREETEPKGIWGKPSIRVMLRQSVGEPIVLTKEEAREIARTAFGSNPDLPPGEEFVRRIRPLIGRSILRKIKRAGD